ncbi:hypothetical protein T265_08062 [Opisthorchis viverrini]|uniref:Uncharacterized protein n=1 Tax=Opisthorchis viverrini TaxID=6198 RepID=A0A074ZAC3_OPIVI|nr:hypothetical protein T265_08062 [Opisthorchis viverrini]KER24216.1 hypothetical protein T265_08062 [Opisthorchis viverrini]
MYRGCYMRWLALEVKKSRYLRTHLQIHLVFTRDSTESLVYDILQLNVLHTSRLMFQLNLSSSTLPISSSPVVALAWPRAAYASRPTSSKGPSCTTT